MQHPNAVTVTDFGATEDGYLYIVMELLEGRTLRDLLARDAPLDPARAVSLMLQACAAVGAAHDAGLIHRDLKPANIFIEQRPNLPAVVKVLDFGVAKFVVEEQDDDFDTLTQVGAIIGTPRYMSPEQCSGSSQLTPAADVYSLGIILYEMLTGAPPFNADTPLAVALKQVSEAPLTPREIIGSIPPPLERIVLRALTKNPLERPHDANELRRELQETAFGLGFESAESIAVPTIDDLRSAGTESPSGRLVIDLATLRQVQAATTASGSLEKPVGKEVPAAQKSERRQFDRLDVPFGGKKQRRSQMAIAAIIVVVAILGSAVLAVQWWRGANGVSGAAVNASPTQTPTPTPTATPTPTPTPTPRPTPKPQPTKTPKRGPVKKVFDKLKGIFR
jgi:serine/threonine protein kinase